MYYHTNLTVADGMSDRRCRIDFTSKATTHDGILRALAKAIVDKFGTDAFEVSDRIMRRQYKDEFSTAQVRLTCNDRIRVWEIAHDYLMGA